MQKFIRMIIIPAIVAFVAVKVLLPAKEPVVVQATEPVILMNPFQLIESEQVDFLTRWQAVADFMRQQPGFVSTSLHQDAQNNGQWFNYAIWQSKQNFLDAIKSEKFQQLTANFPGKGRPNLYEIHTHCNRALCQSR